MRAGSDEVSLIDCACPPLVGLAVGTAERRVPQGLGAQYGQPISRFEVFIGDQQWIGTNGVATIRGLTLGKHTVHVAAETRRSRTLEIRIDDEEGGAFTTVLGPRR